MATLKEFESADNATGVMPEYKSKLTRISQYLNRSVAKFLLDAGTRIKDREVAIDADAKAAVYKNGDFYSRPGGAVHVIKS